MSDKEQIAKLAEFIRYWSYCTFQGMRVWCPEKDAELRQALGEMGISPYSGDAGRAPLVESLPYCEAETWEHRRKANDSVDALEAEMRKRLP